jgi:predicted DNA-binding transcriptional regulator AlpA
MSKAQRLSRVTAPCAPAEAAQSPAQLVDLRGRAITQAALQFAPAFLRTRDVLRITSLSRATIYRRIAARRFPAPVHLGGRACGWSTSALQDWISDPEGYCAPATENSGGTRTRGRPPKYSGQEAP